MSCSLQALIFDVDGTLADTEKDGHRPAFNAAFAEANLNWQWSVARYGELLQVTGGKERIYTYIQEEHPALLSQHADIQAFISALHQRKTAHYISALQEGAIPLRHGVARLIQEAHAAGIRLAIATTTTLDNVTALLNAAQPPGLLAYFEVIGAGDVVAHKKPAPDIYTWVLERLQLPAQACVAIEDSEHGARAAFDAGITAQLITVNDYTALQDFSIVPSVVDCLGEPDKPMQCLAGSTFTDQPYITLHWLKQLHHMIHCAMPL
jgi:HAD superfamily hydrolase (TIGR01509 family)